MTAVRNSWEGKIRIYANSRYLNYIIVKELMLGKLHSSTRKKRIVWVGLLQNNKFPFLIHVHNSDSVKIMYKRAICLNC